MLRRVGGAAVKTMLPMNEKSCHPCEPAQTHPPRPHARAHRPCPSFLGLLVNLSSRTVRLRGGCRTLRVLCVGLIWWVTACVVFCSACCHTSCWRVSSCFACCCYSCCGACHGSMLLYVLLWGRLLCLRGRTLFLSLATNV